MTTAQQGLDNLQEAAKIAADPGAADDSGIGMIVKNAFLVDGDDHHVAIYTTKDHIAFAAIGTDGKIVLTRAEFTKLLGFGKAAFQGAADDSG